MSGNPVSHDVKPEGQGTAAGLQCPLSAGTQDWLLVLHCDRGRRCHPPRRSRSLRRPAQARRRSLPGWMPGLYPTLRSPMCTSSARWRSFCCCRCSSGIGPATRGTLQRAIFRSASSSASYRLRHERATPSADGWSAPPSSSSIRSFSLRSTAPVIRRGNDRPETEVAAARHRYSARHRHRAPGHGRLLRHLDAYSPHAAAIFRHRLLDRLFLNTLVMELWLRTRGRTAFA